MMPAFVLRAEELKRKAAEAEEASQTRIGEGERRAPAELGGEAGRDEKGEQLGQPAVPRRTGLSAVAPTIFTEPSVPVHTVQGELHARTGETTEQSC